VTPEEFRSAYIHKPEQSVLSGYSSNPRNSIGLWYEELIGKALTPICDRLGLQKLEKANRRLLDSKVYLTDKVVDVVLRRGSGARAGRETLGLELKFLGGTGSLVAPKSFVDAVDFTNRPYYCLYVIDGEGWLEGGKTSFVDYLARWWEFTCSAYLDRSVSAFFE
jgi:hypothetical protein